MKKYIKFSTNKLNEIFNIDCDNKTIYDEFEIIPQCPQYEGELNPFYGKKHTKETKQKLRKIILNLCKDENFRATRANFGDKNGMYKSKRCGELNPMWGKKHSQETKKKQSEKRKEWFKNNINPNKGKPCSEKTKEMISEKNSKIYKLISPSGEILEIKNLTKFSKENNLNIGCMQQVVSGRNKTHKGWKKYE